MKRGTKPIKKVNAKRKRANYARQYHSVERVEMVKSLPCAACAVVGYSENAHVCGVEGMGRKGHYTTIAPLCGPRGINPGCHRLFDEHRYRFNWRHPDFYPETAAAECERAWLAYQARKSA